MQHRVAERAPGVGGGLKDLGRVVKNLAAGRTVDGSGDHQLVAVRQRGIGGIPTPGIHIRHTGEGIGCRVVDGGMRVANVIVNMAAGDEQPAITQVRVAGAEQVVAGQAGIGDRIAGRIPDQRRGAIVVGRQIENFSGGQQHDVGWNPAGVN